eukprot:gene34327-41547_t
MAPKKILMLHLDLGIGGAENLVVQVACCLQKMGYEVDIYTTHHDVNHCFEETKPDGVLGKNIHVHGDFLPRHFFGLFTAFFAILRMMYLAYVISIFLDPNEYDCAIIDGVSAPVPTLRWGGYRVVYYCHFPDLLLCTDRSSLLKRTYRLLMDYIEMQSTSAANLILVNSETLHRYERKKKIEVAIDAFRHYKTRSADTISTSHPLLIIAGGYDPRVKENVEYLLELHKYCDKVQLTWKYVKEAEFSDACEYDEIDNNANEDDKSRVDVIFRISISSAERTELFSVVKALLYTPDKEHFGIVPIEAMMHLTPVIAVNSGGPVESVGGSGGGLLVEQSGEQFGDAMLQLVSSADQGEELGVAMGRKAREHVVSNFSEEAMQRHLARYLQSLPKKF